MDGEGGLVARAASAVHGVVAPRTFCFELAFRLWAHSMTAAPRKKSEPEAPGHRDRFGWTATAGEG
eukprot:scaffold17608_cov51-Isochrysis_galbana.AAC.1